jgi:hypothetical protein
MADYGTVVALAKCWMSLYGPRGIQLLKQIDCQTALDFLSLAQDWVPFVISR